MASPVPMSTISISTAALSAEVSATGAELVRLRDRTGADLLWDGDPAFWNGRSPLLFPIVGEVKRNRLNVAGKGYGIGRHGFARRRPSCWSAPMPSPAPGAWTATRRPVASIPSSFVST